VSEQFHELLMTHHCKQSMSRPGTPHDNAVMESWWSLFKTDWVYQDANELAELSDMKKLIEEGIKYFNTKRSTRKRGGLTPQEIRNQTA